MKTSLTILEKVVSIFLLLIGVLFTYQALYNICFHRFVESDFTDSYRISTTTLVSNLVNGNFLIISSLFFLKKRSLGALLYQYTGVLFIFYAINLDLLDIVLHGHFDSLTAMISGLILFPFGLFLYFYFQKKALFYKSKLAAIILFVFGLITYLYINLLFYDRYY